MNSSFTVSHYLNRIGIRLHSENQSEFAHSLELPSEPSQVGVVQITPNGEAILIGPDGPTIGGYPRIAIVPFFAIGFVAQLKPSDQVRFHEISLQEAVAARKNWTARITKYAGLIQTLAAVQT
jgi:allophanate hydrolase subunit 2